MTPQSETARSLRMIKAMMSVFLGIVLLYLMRELSNLFIPLFFAFFFAILFQPIVHLFQRWLSVNASIALTTITTMIIFFFIGFGLFNAVSAFVDNSDTILESISTDLRPMINSYTELLGIEFKEGELKEGLSRLIQSEWLLSASGSFFNSLSGMAAELLMTILYFAGLLGAITQFDHTIRYLLSGTAREEDKALGTFRRIKDSVSIYIKVKTLISLITGIATGMICFLFGIDYALLWGFLAFVLNYIPYVGSLIAIIPPLILGILQFDSVSHVFLLFACLEGAQLIMGNIFEPKMMGDSFSINTVSVLFGLVFWAFLWGTAGMLLAVPLTFLFKVIIEHVSDATILVRLMEKKKLIKE